VQYKNQENVELIRSKETNAIVKKP